MSHDPYLPDDVDTRTLDQERQPVGAGRAGCLTPNVITVVFLLLTLAYLVYFGVLLANPYLPINPFPPRTPLPVYVVATADPRGLAASPSPTKIPEVARLTTLVPTVTPTATPSLTPSPTVTQIVITPPRLATRMPLAPTMTLIGGAPPEQAAGVVITPPPAINPAEVTRSPYLFTVYGEAATYTANANGQGCRWASIAGTVVGLNGEALVGLAVHVVGEGIDEIRFTGTAPAFGPAGYEVFLNSAPLEAQYVVQLLSQTGTPVSEEFTVVTSPECEANVAIVTFIQNHS